MKRLLWVLFGFVLGALTMVLFMVEFSFVHHTIDTPSRVPGARSSFSSSAFTQTEAVFTVTHVADGDTIDVQNAEGVVERVRLVGIDTPEAVDPRREVQCFGKEASAHMKKILDGKTVTMEAKPDEDRDAYGRLLRYVYLDGRDIGLSLLSDGYAMSICKKFPHEKCEEYELEAKKAELAQRGLWSSCRK